MKKLLIVIAAVGIITPVFAQQASVNKVKANQSRATQNGDTRMVEHKVDKINQMVTLTADQKVVLTKELAAIHSRRSANIGNKAEVLKAHQQNEEKAILKVLNNDQKAKFESFKLDKNKASLQRVDAPMKNKVIRNANDISNKRPPLTESLEKK